MSRLNSAKWTLSSRFPTTPLIQRRAYLAFLPSPRLKLEVSGTIRCPENDFDAKLNGQGTRLRLVGQFLGSPQSNLLAKHIFSPVGLPVPGGLANAAIQTAKFHLFNFPKFIVGQGENSGLGLPFGAVRLCADNWEIIITRTVDVDKKVEFLEEQGGYLITHVAQVRKCNGATFSTAELNEVRERCWYFLSFVTGRFAGVTLPVGYDQAGKIVWEDWRNSMMARNYWNIGLSWFGFMNGQSLAETFPGFCTLWNQSIWQNALRSHA